MTSITSRTIFSLYWSFLCIRSALHSLQCWVFKELFYVHMLACTFEPMHLLKKWHAALHQLSLNSKWKIRVIRRAKYSYSIQWSDEGSLHFKITLLTYDSPFLLSEIMKWGNWPINENIFHQQLQLGLNYYMCYESSFYKL